MRKRFFTLEYWQEDNWFIGKIREVPGIFSQGETLAELKENIADAYRMMLENESESVPEGACYLQRHGKRHDIYANPATGRRAPVPRHPEIKESLVRLIDKQLGL